MPQPIIENNWPLGWIPSNDLQKDGGDGYSPSANGLLRMDNLTLDAKGTIRLAKAPNPESVLPFPNNINSIAGAYFKPLKYRYIYDSTGTLLRNYGSSNAQNTFDKSMFTGGTTRRLAYLNTLGTMLLTAGVKQLIDAGGSSQYPLGLPAAAPPALGTTGSDLIDLEDLDGSGNYTNWTDYQSNSAFTNTGPSLTLTPNLTSLYGGAQATFGSPVDTTNFGLGTGMDQPSDIFQFSLECDNPSALLWFSITLGCGANPLTLPFFWQTFNVSGGDSNETTVNLSSGVATVVSMLRSSFNASQDAAGTQPAWAAVTSILIEFAFSAPTNVTFSGFEFTNGNPYSGLVTYLCAEVNSTGQFVMFGLASTQVSITPANNFVTVDRSGTACNANANGIRFFRMDTVLGQFLEVGRQSGAYGFTPAKFTDFLTDTQVLEAAALDQTKVLQFFRIALTQDIVGMLWFATRVIYLNASGFYPSFELDPGSYDSRFFYQLIGEASEQCLFMCALNVGQFIVATTNDFYQVSGTFALITTTNADGSTTTIQDVTIQKLGISDAAISSQFMEVEGTILYLSATGVRSLSVSTSTSINTSLELLFRNEERFGFPPISLLPADQSTVACVSSGYRIYWSLPCADGYNRVFVSTFNIPLPTELRGNNYWRLLSNLDPTTNPNCIFREQDGTIIFAGNGGIDNFVSSLENNTTLPLPINLLTQLNFGVNSTIAKKAGALGLMINTGGETLNVAVTGIDENGVYWTTNFKVNTGVEMMVYLDTHLLSNDPEGEYLGFYIQITGTTSAFSLNYFFHTIVLEYPPVSYYELMLFTNFGKAESKKISTIPMVIDDLGNPVTINVRADEITFPPQTYDPTDEPSTVFWNNPGIDQQAVDWQVEVIAPQGMRFYKFLPPTILQIFPMGKLYDMLGPFELDRIGIIFGFRIRIMMTGAPVNYKVYEQDTLIWDGINDIPAGINAPLNKDSIVEVVLPKGVNSSVCRIVLTCPAIFYRYSFEVKVRSTGKETEEKWVEIK